MKKNGFTLIELLVVISIIAILSLIGYAVYTGVNGAARDARRKEDIISISNALESRRTKDGVYSAAVGSDFTSGSPPAPPEGGTYWSQVNSESFKVCAVLEDKSEYCKKSAMGDSSSIILGPWCTPQKVNLGKGEKEIGNNNINITDFSILSSCYGACKNQSPGFTCDTGRSIKCFDVDFDNSGAIEIKTDCYCLATYYGSILPDKIITSTNMSACDSLNQ